MPDSFIAFLKAHVARVEPLTTAMHRAHWDAAVTGSEADNRRASELENQLMRIYANPEEFAQIRAWRAQPPADPLLRRQLELLYLAYAAGQQDEATIDAITEREARIRGTFYNYRGLYRGEPRSDNELEQVLSTETDSRLLREAWEASKQVGAQVATTVLEVARLRNEAARRAGYRDHYQRSLTLSEIDEGRLFAVLDDLERRTREPYRREKAALDEQLAARYGIAMGDLRPWHYHNPFFQRPPQVGAVDVSPLFAGRDLVAIARRTFANMGLDVEDVLARSDLYARPGKNQHAFCTDIDRRGDVRVLCNMESSPRWAETILHELGHAVYFKHHDPCLPYLLRQPAHTLSTEAIAMLMGRLALDPRWLVEEAGVAPQEVERFREPLRRQQRLAMLILVRWMLVMTHFERSLYADPEQDLNRLWWDYVERFQMVPRPEGRDAPDWAAKIHLALYPVYYQNYMLGELMASQLRRAIDDRCGGLVGRACAGQWLIRAIFAPGASQDWESTLRSAVGEPLDARYFVDEFVA